MLRRKGSSEVNQKAHRAMAALLEELRRKSRFKTRKALSLRVVNSEQFYGMLIKGSSLTDPRTLRRFCSELKANDPQARSAQFLLAAAKWQEETVASAMVGLAGPDVDRLAKAYDRLKERASPKHGLSLQRRTGTATG